MIQQLSIWDRKPYEAAQPEKSNRVGGGIAPAAFTAMPSAGLLDFEDIGLLIRHGRLILISARKSRCADHEAKQ